MDRFDGPTGVAIDPSPRGFLYVADRRNHRVRAFTREGIARWIVGASSKEEANNGRKGGAGLHHPSGIAVDPGPDGLVYVADAGNNRVQAFTPVAVPRNT